jgi:hypothetical protein
MTGRDLARALQELAETAGRAQDGERTTWSLAAAVVELERAAGAGLGTAGCDPLVLLQRRLGGRTGCCSRTPGPDAARAGT